MNLLSPKVNTGMPDGVVRYTGSSRRRRTLVALLVVVLGSLALYLEGSDRAFLANPYLVIPEGTDVVIRGFSMEAERWSATRDGASAPLAAEKLPSAQHEMSLASLKSGEDISLSVRNLASGAPKGRIHYRPDPWPSSQPFDVAVVGDSGAGCDRIAETMRGAFGRSAHKNTRELVA